MLSPHPIGRLDLRRRPGRRATTCSASPTAASPSRCAPWTCSARAWARSRSGWRRRPSTRRWRTLTSGRPSAVPPRSSSRSAAPLAEMATRRRDRPARWSPARRAAYDDGRRDRPVGRRPAVQLHGARALERGHLLEHLYREVRAPRIYEGAQVQPASSRGSSCSTPTIRCGLALTSPAVWSARAAQEAAGRRQEELGGGRSACTASSRVPAFAVMRQHQRRERRGIELATDRRDARRGLPQGQGSCYARSGSPAIAYCRRRKRCSLPVLGARQRVDELDRARILVRRDLLP